MDFEYNGILALAIAACIGVIIGCVGVLVFFFLPTWFIITSNWDAVLYWLPLLYTILRYCSVISIILSIYAIGTKKFAYIYLLLWSVVMLWFGYPALIQLYITLISTPLTGLELQRTLIQLLTYSGLGVTVSVLLISGDVEQLKTQFKKLEKSI